MSEADEVVFYHAKSDLIVLFLCHGLEFSWFKGGDDAATAMMRIPKKLVRGDYNVVDLKGMGLTTLGYL